MKLVNIPAFIISLSIGIFLTYIFNPKPNIIYVYPTPDNIDKIQYKDASDTCFGFSSNEIKCPTDKKSIRSYPIQQEKKQ
jgi:hypothetical protein